jgi:hypothetical protein
MEVALQAPFPAFPTSHSTGDVLVQTVAASMISDVSIPASSIRAGQVKCKQEYGSGDEEPGNPRLSGVQEPKSGGTVQVSLAYRQRLQ